MMYYHVAMQVNHSSTWKWKSTVLTSLDALFRFLRLYSAVPQDRLRVFSSSSREDMNEQLVRENDGEMSNSVTASQFLLERRIYVRETNWSASESETPGQQKRGSIAITTKLSLNESSTVMPSVNAMSISSLERRRAEIEGGAGGDNDIPYTFNLPLSIPQVLAWMKLLAKVQRGELEV